MVVIACNRDEARDSLRNAHHGDQNRDGGDDSRDGHPGKQPQKNRRRYAGVRHQQTACQIDGDLVSIKWIKPSSLLSSSSTEMMLSSLASTG